MKIQDRICQELGLDVDFVVGEFSLFATVDNGFDKLLELVTSKSYIHSRIYKLSSHEVRFLYRWYENSWQEYIIAISRRADDGAFVEITQATSYVSTVGGVING